MSYCFDIGGSFIRFGTPGPDGLVAEAGRVATPAEDFEVFAAALAEAIAAMPRQQDAVASISLAGIVDPASGKSVIANVPCCNGRLLQRDLATALRRPVLVTNDADCFALAEARLGVGRGHANVFAIILGSGVGGGIVLNGDLVRGFGGVGGEWGHGPIVDPTAGGLTGPIGPFPCGCGQSGCLDTVGGARGLERLYAAMHGTRRGSDAIIADWRAGEPAARQTVQVFIEHLARALSVAVNTLGASIVPVGGGLASARDLIAALDARLRQMTLADYPEALVVPGARHADGGLVGAGLVAARQTTEAA